MKRLILFFIMLLVLPVAGWGRSYVYIDPSSVTNGNGGCDNPNHANESLTTCTQGASGPYNTWASVVWASDTTYLQRSGTIFSGHVVVGASGTDASHQVILSSYGAGAVPIINPATFLSKATDNSAWSGPDGNRVYTASVSSSFFFVYEDGLPIQKGTGPDCAGGVWYHTSSAPTILYYKPTGGSLSHTVRYITSVYTGATNGIDVSNQSYITVNGLEFDNAFIGVTFLESTAPSNYITIENCKFRYCWNGFYSQSKTGSSNGSIINNYFYREMRGAAAATVDNGMEAQDTWLFQNNELVDVGTSDGSTSYESLFNGADFDQEGLSGQNFRNSHWIGNYIHGGSNISIYLYSCPSVASTNNAVEQNIVVNNGDRAIYLAGYQSLPFSGNTVEYNILANNGAASGSNQNTIMVTDAAGAASMNYLVNNTIYGGYTAFFFTNAGGYYTVRNNLVYGNSLYNVFSWGPYTNITFDYNLYGSVTGNTGDPNHPFAFNGFDDTWNTWNGTHGFDAHSIVNASAGINPLLAGPASGNFRLLNVSSPAAKAGVTNLYSSATTDVYGVPVTNAAGAPIRPWVSIGAAEFTGGKTAIPEIANPGMLDYVGLTMRRPIRVR